MRIIWGYHDDDRLVVMWKEGEIDKPKIVNEQELIVFKRHSEFFGVQFHQRSLENIEMV